MKQRCIQYWKKRGNPYQILGSDYNLITFQSWLSPGCFGRLWWPGLIHSIDGDGHLGSWEGLACFFFAMLWLGQLIRQKPVFHISRSIKALTWLHPSWPEVCNTCGVVLCCPPLCKCCLFHITILNEFWYWDQVVQPILEPPFTHPDPQTKRWHLSHNKIPWGLDSLAGVEFRNRLQASFEGLTLSHGWSVYMVKPYTKSAKDVSRVRLGMEMLYEQCYD